MAFQQGLSGLNATSKNLSIIGNNIANANTFGAKASRAEFADMYANAINGSGSNGVGIGVNLAAVTQQFSQGNIQTTESSMDLAINGNGFFQLDNAGTTVYSRNGQFQINKDGNIVNASGQKLLGYAANSTGMVVPSSIQPLQLPTSGVAPNATSKVALELNLDARAKSIPVGGTPPIDFADPSTYTNATSVTVYDAKGQSVALTYYFQKTADNSDGTIDPAPPAVSSGDGKAMWDVYVTANGIPIPNDGSGLPSAAVITGMTFQANGGSLDTAVVPDVVTMPDVTSVPLTGGGSSLTIPGISLSLKGATQYGAPFSVTNLTQDGYAPGQLSGVSIDKSGIIKAQYSNGQSKAAGQLVLASFRNPQALAPLGGNAWASSFASGDPVIGAAGEGNLGALQSGALEESNVDLTAELVNMITAQRSYQANAQTIKTEDQIMQTLVNLR